MSWYNWFSHAIYPHHLLSFFLLHSLRPSILHLSSVHLSIHLPLKRLRVVRVISIVFLMYADDNGLSTHSPAHTSISLHPSVVRPFALTSDRRGEQTDRLVEKTKRRWIKFWWGGEKQPHLRKQHRKFRKSSDSAFGFVSTKDNLKNSLRTANKLNGNYLWIRILCHVQRKNYN